MSTASSTSSLPRENATKSDVYSRITDRIVAYLERGVLPWVQPWQGGAKSGPVSRPLRHNGQRYSGINVLVLWIEALERGYESPQWMTYKQAQELKGQVRKGEKGTSVVYASSFKKSEEDEKGEEIVKEIRFLREYTVFNIGQIDNLPELFYAKAGSQPSTDKLERIVNAEAFFAATKADIRYGGGLAYYSPSQDYIQMPPLESFRDVASFYGVLGHETVHWTKASSRLNREFGSKVRGDEGYAFEELIAEIGASFLAADLGIENEPREDHAAYICEWIKALRNDRRRIFSAASHATKAVEFLHGLQPQQTS